MTICVFCVCKSMGVFDLCIAKCREVLSELFVSKNTCLRESIYSSLDLDHHIPVFLENGQVIVLDDC